jgi:GT2 family glycosyltransferase
VPSTVAAVIVNYNGQELIDSCLESLLSQDRLPDEILVIDNASWDQSSTLVKEKFPDVHLIESGQNLGYAGACNLGIRETSSDLVAFLNNDLVLDRAWLRTLLNATGAPWSFWASRIVFAGRPSIIDSAGDAMAIVGAAYKIGHGRDAAQFMKPREVFGPCGAAALYRRDLLDQVGGFDSDFFLIYEDSDLNMRARLQGHRCLYVPDALVHHRVNQSIGQYSDTYVFYGHRNSEFLFWKNMPTSLLLRYLPERLLFNLLSFAYFTVKGRAPAFIRAKWDFLRRLREVRVKRRLVQSASTVSATELLTMMDRNWLRHRIKPAVQ